MKRKPSLAAAKKRAWDQFSIYIRTRDCLAYLKTHPEMNELCAPCVTCQRVYVFKQLQAGHWIPGRNNAVLFSEIGVHAQCDGCNRHKKGNPIPYWLFMEATYGRDTMDVLLLDSNQIVKYKVWDYDEIRDKYKTLTEELLKESAAH